ncbi:MAG: hypothetical protein HY767_01875 [Candidatus Omnitrophica bacterium]|nr:hypothetical protein [Candidatus Omnitrophota bacterium]
MNKYGTGFYFLLIKGNQCRPNFSKAEIDKYWDGSVRIEEIRYADRAITV